MRSGMKYLLAVPVVILLAAAFYIFYVYDPNPSKNTNNEVSIARNETKQTGSPEAGTTTVTDAAELATAPVTLPIAEERSAQASSEESQAEATAPGKESSSEIAISEEAESAESFVSTADGDSTDEAAAEIAEATIAGTTEEVPDETAPSSVDDQSTEEAATSIAIDASKQEPPTSTAVDESLEETSASVAAAEELIEESLPEDATAKRITYVDTGSADSPQGASYSEDYSRETAAQGEEKQSQSIVASEQQPLSGGYTEHKAVINSSLSQAASDAGMSANQSARIERVFKPYLDSSRELRKGDELTIFLDPGVANTGNDADQIHRLEFHGVRKNLVVIRKERSLSDYEVRDADGKMLGGEVSTTSIATGEPIRQEAPVEPVSAAVASPPQEVVVEEPASEAVEPRREVLVEQPEPAVEESQREVSVEPVAVVEKPRSEMSVEPVPAVERSPRKVATPVDTLQRSVADYTATGEMKRIEGVVSITLFSAAKEAGLNAVQLKKLEEIMSPYIDFNKDVRKGDRILITLDGSDIYSSEFNGVVKKLTLARDDDGSYREVKPGDTETISSESGDGDSNARKPPFWKRWWRSFGSSSDES